MFETILIETSTSRENIYEGVLTPTQTKKIKDNTIINKQEYYNPAVNLLIKLIDQNEP